MTKSTMYMLLTIATAFVAIITFAGLIYAATKVDHYYWFSFASNLVVYFFIFRHLAKAKKAAEKTEGAAREKARKEGK